jgi:hypothetical protein
MCHKIEAGSRRRQVCACGEEGDRRTFSVALAEAPTVRADGGPPERHGHEEGTVPRRDARVVAPSQVRKVRRQSSARCHPRIKARGAAPFICVPASFRVFRAARNCLHPWLCTSLNLPQGHHRWGWWSSAGSVARCWKAADVKVRSNERQRGICLEKAAAILVDVVHPHPTTNRTAGLAVRLVGRRKRYHRKEREARRVPVSEVR